MSILEFPCNSYNEVVRNYNKIASELGCREHSGKRPDDMAAVPYNVVGARLDIDDPIQAAAAFGIIRELVPAFYESVSAAAFDVRLSDRTEKLRSLAQMRNSVNTLVTCLGSDIRRMHGDDFENIRGVFVL